jgi:hypothetical protein
MTLAKDLHDWGRRAVLLANYALAFALELRKSTENLSQVSRVAKRLLLAPTCMSFEGKPRLACRASVEYVKVVRHCSLTRDRWRAEFDGGDRWTGRAGCCPIGDKNVAEEKRRRKHFLVTLRIGKESSADHNPDDGASKLLETPVNFDKSGRCNIQKTDVFMYTSVILYFYYKKDAECL